MSGVQNRIAGLTAEQRKLLELRLKRKNLSLDAVQGIPRRSDPEPHPVSANQEWLWKIVKRTGGFAGWNVYTGMRFTGPVDVGAIARSLNRLARRHQVLRAAFPAGPDGRPVQVSLPDSCELQVPLVDLSALPEALREPLAQEIFGQRWRQLFDLENGPVARFTLVRQAPEQHALLVMIHHIATDWVSYNHFEREMAVLYNSEVTGRPVPVPPGVLPELPIQYSDYSYWERDWLQTETAREHLEYWVEKLRGLPPLRLPLDRPRPAIQTYRGRRPHLFVEEDVTQGLKALAREEEVSLFFVLIAAIQALLSHLSGQTDIALGSPVAGRQRRELESPIGLLLNYLAFRTDLSEDPTFRELVRRVRKVVLDAYAHQDLPFGAVLDALDPEWDLSRSPIFQATFFFLENPPLTTPASDVGVRLLVTYGGTSRFDLLVSIWDQGPTLEGWFEHNTAIHDTATAEGWIETFLKMLAAAAENPDRRLSELA